MKTASPPPETDAQDAQARAVLLVADAIGEVMRFWNFKPSMGKIWTILYLCPDPMDAEEIEAVSGLSAGMVSMTLQELSQWGVIRRVPGASARRRAFTAETDIWALVARVFQQRELKLVDDTIAHLQEALRILETEGRSSRPAAMLTGRFQVTRVQNLLQLARTGRAIVARLASTGSADLAPLRDVLRGRA